MSSLSCVAFQVISCHVQKRPSIHNKHSNLKPIYNEQPLIKAAVLQVPNMLIDQLSKTIKQSTEKLLDAFVALVFEFVNQPLLPSQSNFTPVDELGGPNLITSIDGNIDNNFPEGVYLRNGANPLFGGLKSTKSVFGRSRHIWIEGEGMLHALYFTKDDNDCKWTVHYNNKYVETETYKQEKQRNKPSFIPIIEGDLPAVICAALLNLLRFGKIDKCVSNTNVFEHSGKLYSIAESHMPQEIGVFTLETVGNWVLSRQWNRPFTSHPKGAPETRELVIIGVNAIYRPFLELGVISADGRKLVHRADLKFDRCTFCHDFGVTYRYNVLMDFPVTIDIIRRLCTGGPLIKYNNKGYARIGVMPRYGDAGSIKWFKVEPNCTFHIINCFEDGDDEVVVWGYRALESVLPFDNSAKGGLVHNHAYEWRLNMQTGEVRERNLTADTELYMEVPLINPNFIGFRNRFAYAQVCDSLPRSNADNMLKFRGLAKLHFDQLHKRFSLTTREVDQEVIKVEYHMFEENTFCSGATFVPKRGGFEEDDGWIITFVHNEDTNISQVCVIDTKKFLSEPVSKITLPCRVPYGFHGAFIPFSV